MLMRERCAWPDVDADRDEHPEANGNTDEHAHRGSKGGKRRTSGEQQDTDDDDGGTHRYRTEHATQRHGQASQPNGQHDDSDEDG